MADATKVEKDQLQSVSPPAEKESGGYALKNSRSAMRRGGLKLSLQPEF